MPSLPTVGQAVWGAQLNAYLSVEHNTNGTHKNLNVPGFRSPDAYLADPTGATDSSAAIIACKAALIADGGGIMQFGPGTYRSDSVQVLSDNVEWRGVGRFQTTVSFPVDPGAGVFSLDGFGGTGGPGLRDLRLLGSSFTSYGTKPRNGNGVRLTYKNPMTRVVVMGFNVGVALPADHTTMRECVITENYWGVDFPEVFINHGNQSFYECDFTGNALTGVHCSGDNFIDNCMFFNCHFGFGPFGVLGEGFAAGAQPAAGFLSNTDFIGGGFEYVGNAAIADLATNGRNSWLNNTIQASGYSDGGASFRAGAPYNHDYTILLPGAATGGYIRNNFYPFGGGAVRTYGFSQTAADLLVYSQTYDPVLYPGAVMETTTGRFRQYTASGTITRGDLVELTTGSNVVRRATGLIGTSAVIGAARVSVTNGQLVWVNNMDSETSVLCETVSAAGIPIAQVTGTPYRCGLASTYLGSPVVGYSTGAGGNGGATAEVFFEPRRG